ncbi:hypothetical protein [Rhodopila sp.]|uniref:hypothetical protein n=1 Tax=Rhodopila sp. TaxID=2480087 RepID=UPI002BF59B61|nr:hypothetical protein [Rhodopila sp.]HVZ09423.1 hypothetical protein [Rhodopila sp.]
MWSEPYLETCCRAALHRLYLSGPDGRTDAGLDGPCLRRLECLGLCRRDGERFRLLEAGRRRHATEILKSPATPEA